MKGGVVLSPPGMSLVLDSGQQLVSHHSNSPPPIPVNGRVVDGGDWTGTNKQQQSSTAGYPSGAGEAQSPPPSSLSKILDKLAILLVLATAALAAVDAFLLWNVMGCLGQPNGSSILYPGLAMASVAFSVAGLYYSFIDHLKTRVNTALDIAPEELDEAEAAARVRANRCRRYKEQMMEDASIFLAVLPTILGLFLRASDIFSKCLAVLAVVTALMPFRVSFRKEYPCRKLVSLFVLVVAVGLLVLTFTSLGNDKSLVIYEVRDPRTNSTWRLSRDEDQIQYFGTKYCETIDGTPCVPCFLPAIYGRGNNTWYPLRNDTGQCAGVTLTITEAYDCTDLGKRVPIAPISVFQENTCALNTTIKCHEIINPGRVEAV